MTDEQIRVELARRVMGWERDSECYWDPFTDWNDAMGLAEKFRETHSWKLVVGNIATDDGSWHAVAISPRGIADWQQVRDKSGPRAVTMAVAKAADQWRNWGATSNTSAMSISRCSHT